MASVVLPETSRGWEGGVLSALPRLFILLEPVSHVHTTSNLKCWWHLLWDLACCVLTPSWLPADLLGLLLGPQLPLAGLVALHFGLSGVAQVTTWLQLTVNVRTPHSGHVPSDP